MKKILDFNRDWSFIDIDYPQPWREDVPPAGWTPVTLPHDYGITKGYSKDAPCGGMGGYLAGAALWYRKEFTLTAEEAAKRIFVEFDGVFMNAQVWVNEQLITEHPYGYIGFSADITSAVREGRNVICVKADGSAQPQSRWYNGCGIVQEVRLVMKEAVSLTRHGIGITTKDLGSGAAEVTCTVTLENTTDSPKTVTVDTMVPEGEGFISKAEPATVELAPGETTLTRTMTIENAQLWSVEAPNLYTLRCSVFEGASLLDREDTVFGVRTVEFIPQQGFFLNGQPLKLKGMCLHHDSGVFGAVFSVGIWKKRIAMLKAMGCNAIRTTHNPFDPKFYDLCDRMGMMVMDEFTDVWDQPKAKHDYGNYFAQWHERDMTEFILRDRNHPSVVLWSIGNEIPNITPEKTVELQELVHRLDPSRKVTCGVCAMGEVRDKSRASLDIAGYNDGGGCCFIYERDHEQNPDQLMVATESPHTVQTRGFYRTQTWWRDKNQPRVEIDNLTEEEIFTDGTDYYYSSYDNAGVRFNIRDTWKKTSSLDYLCGEFRWTGIDYYGESPRWPMRDMESGVIDMANFPKDSYYLYQSLWTSPEVRPMLHLLPHWTHPRMAPGTVIPVMAYTNCAEAELFLNGESLGRQQKAEDGSLVWMVPYTPGVLQGVAYYQGQQAAGDTLVTAGAPACFSVTCPELGMAGPALPEALQFDFAIRDSQGNFVPHGQNGFCFFDVRNCRWVGTENGDPIDMTHLEARERRAFYGLCAATIVPLVRETDHYLSAAAILGERYFTGSSTVSIQVSTLSSKGVFAGKYEVYYTTDGSIPTRASARYTGPFPIEKTTTVRAVIYAGDVPMARLQELFLQGEPKPVVLTGHDNKNHLEELPPVTPSQRLQGAFACDSFPVLFLQNGRFVRNLFANTPQQLGYWWFDDEANRGEIWFLTGEKEPFCLNEDDSAVILDNSKDGFFAFKSQPEMVFPRIC